MATVSRLSNATPSTMCSKSQIAIWHWIIASRFFGVSSSCSKSRMWFAGSVLPFTLHSGFCVNPVLHCGHIGGLFLPDFECRHFAPHLAHLYRRDFTAILLAFMVFFSCDFSSERRLPFSRLRFWLGSLPCHPADRLWRGIFELLDSLNESQVFPGFIDLLGYFISNEPEPEGLLEHLLIVLAPAFWILVTRRADR